MRYEATDVISSAYKRAERENLFKVQTIHVHSSSNPLYKQNIHTASSEIVKSHMQTNDDDKETHTHDVNERK